MEHNAARRSLRLDRSCQSGCGELTITLRAQVPTHDLPVEQVHDHGEVRVSRPTSDVRDVGHPELIALREGCCVRSPVLDQVLIRYVRLELEAALRFRQQARASHQSRHAFATHPDTLFGQ
jgi:hypothetical protein